MMSLADEVNEITGDARFYCRSFIFSPLTSGGKMKAEKKTGNKNPWRKKHDIFPIDGVIRPSMNGRETS